LICHHECADDARDQPAAHHASEPAEDPPGPSSDM
jgi:hypothetical protein